MHEVDGHEVDGTEATVDASDKLVDRRPEVLVLLDILARRDGKLCENNFADPLGMLGQEEFESVQLLWDTLDVVQSVDTNDDLDVSEAVLELLNALLDVRFLQVLWDG